MGADVAQQMDCCLGPLDLSHVPFWLIVSTNCQAEPILGCFSHSGLPARVKSYTILRPYWVFCETCVRNKLWFTFGLRQYCRWAVYNALQHRERFHLHVNQRIVLAGRLALVVFQGKLANTSQKLNLPFFSPFFGDGGGFDSLNVIW